MTEPKKTDFIATAAGTWPYHFAAESMEAAVKFVEEELNENGKNDYEWTITVNPDPHPRTSTKAIR